MICPCPSDTTMCIWYAYMCAYIFTYTWSYVYLRYICLHAHVKTEVGIKCLPHLPSTLFLETRSLAELGAQQSLLI